MRLNRQDGFTLVELAVVLLIIGLIVGGILRGQELITSAQLNSVQTDANKIRTAVNTFRDKFVALPGDIANPGDLIDLSSSSLTGFSSGGANGAVGGNGDGRITGDRLDAGTEAVQAWAHLGASGLLSEIDAAAVDGNQLDASNAMDSGVGGFYSLRHGVTGSDNGSNFATQPGNSIWIMLGTNPNGDGDNDDPAIPADQAAQLDRKVDDGDPVNGNVIGNTSGAGADAQPCVVDDGDGNDVYSVNDGTCGLVLEL